MFIRTWFSRSARVVIALLALVAFTPSHAHAQNNAVVGGTVSDAQGGVLPGVTLTLRNAETGVARTSVSESDGRYRFAGLAPGPYELKAELAGFTTVDIKNTTLTIGLEVTQNIRMNIETLQESVTVVGEAPVVETTRSEVAQVVAQQQIETLPVNNRQAITLALLLPGTSQDGTRPRKVNATVGSGGGFSASAFLVDGVSNQQTSAGEPRQDFPQGGIREFKVNVSQAAAEFGGTTGGVVTMVTKSGTNSLSGEGLTAAITLWRAQNGLGPLAASQFSSNRFNSVDLRASKSIPLGGRRKAEVVVQVFNVFGMNNLLPPGGDSYVNNALSDSFGKILTAQPRQQGEIAIRYAF